MPDSRRWGRRKRVSRWLRWRGLRILAGVHRRLPRRRARARVLLECKSPLMANYVMRGYATLPRSEAVAGYITTFDGMTGRHRRDALGLGLRWVSRSMAPFRNWDLVLLADHEPLRYPPSSAKVIIPHGPDQIGRVVKSGTYYYDPDRILWPDGTPVYDLMLESTAFGAEYGAALVPQYVSRIRVVGDLTADAVLENKQSRADASPEGRTRIAVMSTWGPHGLVCSHSDWLFPAVSRLARSDHYEFVVTMHNNLWDPRRAGTDRWRKSMLALAGPHITVLGPDDDWTSVLPTTDLAISDHTSLAAIYSVLGAPIIPVSVPIPVLNPGSFGHWLQTNKRAIGSESDLLVALSHIDGYRLDDAPTMVDRPGECRQLTGEALGEVLEKRRTARMTEGVTAL